MKDIRERSETDKERSKLAKLAAQFIKSFTKNSILNLKNYEEDVEEFINSFLEVEEV